MKSLSMALHRVPIHYRAIEMASSKHNGTGGAPNRSASSGSGDKQNPNK